MLFRSDSGGAPAHHPARCICKHSGPDSDGGVGPDSDGTGPDSDGAAGPDSDGGDSGGGMGSDSDGGDSGGGMGSDSDGGTGPSRVKAPRRSSPQAESASPDEPLVPYADALCILKAVGCKDGITPADQLMNTVRTMKRMSIAGKPSARLQQLKSPVKLQSGTARGHGSFNDCKEMIMMDSSDQSFAYEFPSEHTSMRLRHNGTETWFVSTKHDVPSPMAPGDMTGEQTANVLTLLTTTSTFEIEFALDRKSVV